MYFPEELELIQKDADDPISIRPRWSKKLRILSNCVCFKLSKLEVGIMKEEYNKVYSTQCTLYFLYVCIWRVTFGVRGLKFLGKDMLGWNAVKVENGWLERWKSLTAARVGGRERNTITFSHSPQEHLSPIKFWVKSVPNGLQPPSSDFLRSSQEMNGMTKSFFLFWAPTITNSPSPHGSAWTLDIRPQSFNGK